MDFRYIFQILLIIGTLTVAAKGDLKCKGTGVFKPTAPEAVACSCHYYICQFYSSLGSWLISARNCSRQEGFDSSFIPSFDDQTKKCVMIQGPTTTTTIITDKPTASTTSEDPPTTIITDKPTASTTSEDPPTTINTDEPTVSTTSTTTEGVSPTGCDPATLVGCGDLLDPSTGSNTLSTVEVTTTKGTTSMKPSQKPTTTTTTEGPPGCDPATLIGCDNLLNP